MTESIAPSPPNPFAGSPCRDCGEEALFLELRPTLTVKEVGTFSIAGAQDKLVAHDGVWPWCVCSSCGAESEGKR